LTADRHAQAAEAVDRALWTLVADMTPASRRIVISQLLANLGHQTVNPDTSGSLPEVPDADFVSVAYQRLLARPADEGGLGHYTAALAAGDSRENVLRALIDSAEFQRRDSGVPRDNQLCELANPAKWDNEEWVAILRDLGLSDDKLAMHRKPYEFAQLIFGCRRLGVLDDAASVVSVGAGHEGVLYWLANHVGRVVATDLYEGEGVWRRNQGREGNPDVLEHPDAYAPFPYRKERLTFHRMDGRRLGFDEATFDIAYSLSSIEHIGGLDGAISALLEMRRVLKPGGIVALATEYVVEGPPHDETFQPAEFARLIDQPGLELVEPVDYHVYRRYRTTPVDLYRNPYQTPHMLVRFNETIFTTVMVFLRKTL
jgi:SAM-dependent methyltransferase